MRIELDKAGDALYFRLDESKVVDSEEIRPGVVLDYDAKNQVIGVEFLKISTRATAEELSSFQYKSA